MKPLFPVWRREFFLDALTNKKRYIPRPAWREEFYLAKLAGLDVPVPKAVTLREAYYSKMLGVRAAAPKYKPEYPKIYAFLARAAGQDIQLPRAETREQRYWLEFIQQKGLKMRVELKNYMERVNKRFTEERKAYTERYNEFIADTNRKLTELEKNKADYSPEGYQKKREALNAEKRKNSETLAAICQRFNNSAAKLREACKDEFLLAYGITPKAIDAAALELIKLGVLSGEELLELAQRDYANNATMLRVIGNELQKSEDVALQQKGIALNLRSKDSPHLALFDELVQLCNSCMRPEYYGEDGRLVSVDDAFLLSAATANSYEGAYKVILDKAKQYSAESAE